jgi:hypothetical protein
MGHEFVAVYRDKGIGASLVTVFVQSTLLWSGYVTLLRAFPARLLHEHGTGNFAAVCASRPCA